MWLLCLRTPRIHQNCYQGQNTNSLPVPLALAASVNCVCWSSYKVCIDDAYVWAPYCWIMQVLQIMLYLKYGLPEKSNSTFY